jgi:uncharacterized protein
MPRRIESLFIPGPAGRLEALLEEPDDQAPKEAVLICHPHPKFGGTMHNKVVYRMARAIRRAGAVALRFNYRGVNMSEGTYDDGVGELEDARAALELLRSRYPELPFSLAGFSFGSRIILRLGCERLGCEIPGATRLLAVGFPSGDEASRTLGGCEISRVFIQSTNDQFGPRDTMESYYAALTGPKELIWVDACDHFFADALSEFEEAVFRVAS